METLLLRIDLLVLGRGFRLGKGGRCLPYCFTCLSCCLSYLDLGNCSVQANAGLGRVDHRSLRAFRHVPRSSSCWVLQRASKIYCWPFSDVTNYNITSLLLISPDTIDSRPEVIHDIDSEGVVEDTVIGADFRHTQDAKPNFPSVYCFFSELGHALGIRNSRQLLPHFAYRLDCAADGRRGGYCSSLGWGSGHDYPIH